MGPHEMSSQQTQRCDFHLSPLHLTSSSTTSILILDPFSFPVISIFCQKYTRIPHPAIMSAQRPIKDSAEGSSSRSINPAAPLSRYESQKRRDWNTFGQYLKNQNPPVSLSQCNCNHVLDFLRYLDQFGKTKVHLHGCVFFGQPDPPAPCTCPLRQAWGSLDALIGRLRAAYEEHGGSPESNPFGNGAIRVYLREVKECQAKARGIPYKKKKKKRSSNQLKSVRDNQESKLLKHSSSS